MIVGGEERPRGEVDEDRGAGGEGGRGVDAEGFVL